MRVLKVVADGLTTSFRYPHFMQQIHPSFPMPPPATIYGHICSALGEWFDPAGVRFAFHFTHAGEVRDMEHIIVLKPATGKLPGTKIPKVLEGNINPFTRHLFFQPRLTLYINRPEWEPAFRSPRFAVVLGRSQDLFTYSNVSTVELEQAERVYLQHTLVPHQMALQIGRGVTMLMPRFLDYANRRQPTFEQYVVVQDRVVLPNDRIPRFEHLRYGPYWIDPTAPTLNGTPQGLVFLSFVEETV
ncbi:MAG: type I-B CRISPR-associated protein Cas5 [Anaerolineae bacterium]|nr:type I-B CRISPR-associated protein Cas5 [Anaerolineae bacterium]